MKTAAIVGYGSIGPIHAIAIENADSVRLGAVCDINADRLNKCKEKYDVTLYTDYDEMLSKEKLDSVHICTPHYLHLEMIKKALAMGLEVVCEKPLTMTPSEFSELMELPNLDKLCPIMQNRLNPCMQMLKNIASSGELGAVKTLKGVLTWCRRNDYYNQSDWRGRLATEGGGVLINQAVHTLDFFCYIAGKVSSVKAQMSNFSVEGIEVEDTMAAHIVFKSGVKGVFFATNAYGEDPPPLFEVVFEKGHVRYTDGKLYVNGELSEQDSKPLHGKAYWGGSHTKLIKDFYDEGRYFKVQDVENTMRTMFALYESARLESKAVEVKG